MEVAKTVGIAALTCLVVLAIANRVEIPLVNPRMVSPPSTSTAASTNRPATTGGA